MNNEGKEDRLTKKDKLKVAYVIVYVVLIIALVIFALIEPSVLSSVGEFLEHLKSAFMLFA